MNFVETGKPGFFVSPVPRMAEETEASISTAQAPISKPKAFFTSMALSLIIFPFTLSGLISASNWAIDRYVIPSSQAKLMELSIPLTAEPAADVQTHAADAPIDAAASNQ